MRVRILPPDKCVFARYLRRAKRRRCAYAMMPYDCRLFAYARENGAPRARAMFACRYVMRWSRRRSSLSERRLSLKARSAYTTRLFDMPRV